MSRGFGLNGCHLSLSLPWPDIPDSSSRAGGEGGLKTHRRRCARNPNRRRELNGFRAPERRDRHASPLIETFRHTSLLFSLSARFTWASPAAAAPSFVFVCRRRSVSNRRRRRRFGGAVVVRTPRAEVIVVRRARVRLIVAWQPSRCCFLSRRRKGENAKSPDKFSDRFFLSLKRLTDVIWNLASMRLVFPSCTHITCLVFPYYGNGYYL